jgi:hypothetical protein
MFDYALCYVGCKESRVESSTPFQPQMEPEDSLPCPEEHTTLLCHESHDPLHTSTRRHFEVYFNIILSSTILWCMFKTILISRLFHACYMLLAPNPPCFHHPNYI